MIVAWFWIYITIIIQYQLLWDRPTILMHLLIMYFLRLLFFSFVVILSGGADVEWTWSGIQTGRQLTPVQNHLKQLHFSQRLFGYYHAIPLREMLDWSRDVARPYQGMPTIVHLTAFRISYNFCMVFKAMWLLYFLLHIAVKKPWSDQVIKEWLTEGHNWHTRSSYAKFFLATAATCPWRSQVQDNFQIIWLKGEVLSQPR